MQTERPPKLKLETYADACSMADGLLGDSRTLPDPDYSRLEIVSLVEEFHQRVAEDNHVELVGGRADIPPDTALSPGAKQQAESLEEIWDFMHGF